MRCGGLQYHVSAYTVKKWHPKADIVASQYSFADPRRLAGQKPLKISGGTWAEGYGYTRPYNESIFKTSLPHKLKDFSKAGSYPGAPHSTSYFISEMKKVFKIDLSNGIGDDKKNEKALLEAWDYFREQAKELSDVA